MKTIYILLFFVFGSSVQLMAQYEYYDALKIKEYSETGYRHLSVMDKVDLAKRLTKSRPIGIDNSNADTIAKTIIRSNKFLNALFKLAIEDNTSKASDTLRKNRTGGQAANPFLGTFPSSAQAAISSIGGIDVTNIANGVAMLMIDRAKQELTVAFFNRFQAYSEKYPEFQVLFPKTTDNLLHLLSYKYPEMLPALRVSFFEDIDKLPLHLDDVLELPKYRDMLQHFPEIRVAIRTVRLVSEIESGEANAAEVLTQFASFKEWNAPNTSDAFFNFGNTVKLADIISQSLRYNATLEKNPVTTLSTATNTNGDISSVVTRFSYINKEMHLVDSSVTISTMKLPDGTIKTKTSSAVNVADSVNQADNKRIWITPEQVKKLVTNDTLFRIYLGLVTEKIKSDSIRWRTKDTTIYFGIVMEDNAENIFLLENKISEFMSLANKIDKFTDSIKVRISQHLALTEDDYYDYIDGSMDVIEYAFSFAQLFDTSVNISNYILIARNANDLYRHVYKKQYTQALTDAISILEMSAKMIDNSQYASLLQSLQDKSGISLEKAIKDGKLNKQTQEKLTDFAASNAKQKANVDKVLLIDAAQDKLENLIDILGKLNQYGLFMANMIDAQTPEEVEDVLDNAILPVGSSSIKKSACLNISIQSYLGAYYRFAGKDHAIDNAWDDRFGVTAPIGISVSHGFNKLGSLSLFASLFDIGAIVDYQLQKDTVITSSAQTSTAIQKEYSIKLEQIISPGFYLVYGCGGNVPLALGAGAQYGPGLGKIDIGNNNLLERNPSWRFNVFLGVDLPFFNLWNKTKGYKFKNRNLSK